MTAIASSDETRIGPVGHASARTWCDEKASGAVISVIERNDSARPLRFVIWCSLRGCGRCDEACLHTPGG